MGWLPPKCSRTSPELRQQLLVEHAQRLALAEGWQRMDDWYSRLSVGRHERGLGVGAWVIGNHTGSPCIGKITAWNWTGNRELGSKSTTGRGDGAKHKAGGGSGWKDQVMTQKGLT